MDGIRGGRSGHGLSAGLLMAMFKTAARTRVEDASTTELLAEVHRALYPLKTPNMFATVGVLQWTGRIFNLTLAGDLPLLHYVRSCSEVREYPSLDLPLGFLPHQTFRSTEVVCQTGDIFVLLTDGLTEVFDRSGREMGIAPLKEVLPDQQVRSCLNFSAACGQRLSNSASRMTTKLC